MVSRIHSCLFSDWRHTVSSKFFDTQVPSISTEELVLPRCVLFRVRCNGHSLLLSCYLSRIGRIENPSCSACGHPSQDISHLILHCPATDSLRRSLFGDTLSLYDLWSRPWRVARLLGLHGLPPCPCSATAGTWLWSGVKRVHSIRRLVTSIMIATIRRFCSVYILILLLVTFGLWFVTSSCSYDS